MDKDVKWLKKAKEIIESTALANIIAIITLLVTIIFGVLSSNTLNNEKIINNTNNNKIYYYTIIVFVIMISVTVVNLFFRAKRMSKKTNELISSYKTTIKNYEDQINKYQVISILSELQNKYILKPDFKSSKEHSNSSQEKNLQEQGEAKILTNSLSYDIFYCNEIAKNLIDGARYIYVLPNEFQTIHDLQNYISELYDNLFKQLSNTYHYPPVKITSEVTKKLTNNLEFWFFNRDVLCLYNFARFNQVGHDNFLQSWWYVNPTEKEDNSYMLAHEIEREDQEKLHTAFDTIFGISKIYNGNIIYKNKENLEDFLSREG